MGVKLNVDADFSEARALFARLEGVPSGAQQPLSEIGLMLAERAQENIRNSRTWDGKPLQPLAAVTLIARAGGKRASTKRGGFTQAALRIMSSAKPLLDHGNLLDSYTYTTARDAVVIGSVKDQAGVMHFGAKQGQFGRSKRGSPIPWGDIPARPVLGINAQSEQDIVQIMNDYITRTLQSR